MHEIQFRGQTADEIIPHLVGKRLDGAVADLTEVTLTNLFKIAARRGARGVVMSKLYVYPQPGDRFDAQFCCEGDH